MGGQPKTHYCIPRRISAVCGRFPAHAGCRLGTLLTALVRRAERDHRELATAQGVDGRRRIELLERRFQAGETIREIAADWGVPAQDVHNLYRKARAEFRACLRRVVAAHIRATEDVDGECERLLALLA